MRSSARTVGADAAPAVRADADPAPEPTASDDPPRSPHAWIGTVLLAAFAFFVLYCLVSEISSP